MAPAFWNGKDTFIKERLFGLTGPQGNHGEDVKETYFYADSHFDHSYCHSIYCYPTEKYPYEELVQENQRRDREQAEYELEDTGIFKNGYWLSEMEYSKPTPLEVVIRITLTNNSPADESLHLLFNLWFRNTWPHSATSKPQIQIQENHLEITHPSLGNYLFYHESLVEFEDYLLSENEAERKDAFQRYIVDGCKDVLNEDGRGTKAAAHYVFHVAAGKTATVRFRLVSASQVCPADISSCVDASSVDGIIVAKRKETDAFYANILPCEWPQEWQLIGRQALSGLLWSKQFYLLDAARIIDECHRRNADGPAKRLAEWRHLKCSDIILMPDKWEFPWLASWDLAFHVIPFALVDLPFAKEQLKLLLSDRYQHPNGQIPGCEFAFSDPFPPILAWSCLKLFRMSCTKSRDKSFLRDCFPRLELNFEWWMKQCIEGANGRRFFSGGFLGMDNISVFNRSDTRYDGSHILQVDGTAWLALFALNMIEMALELVDGEPSLYEKKAVHFLNEFIRLADSVLTFWNDSDGFFYDKLLLANQDEREARPLAIRSYVGLVPLCACAFLPTGSIGGPLEQRLNQLNQERSQFVQKSEDGVLLSVCSQDQIEAIVAVMMNEKEFLSPYGIRSLSKIHEEKPYCYEVRHHDGHCERHEVAYHPGESKSGLFGGNSNWRGPVWLPVNYIIMCGLNELGCHYGDGVRVSGVEQGQNLTLKQAAKLIARRVVDLFIARDDGSRPWHGKSNFLREEFPTRSLFHEYYHGETGAGCGSSHQSGWSALVVSFMSELIKRD